MSAKIARCGHSVPYADGDQGPCDRVATGWRWYQDAEHEDLLEVACFLHENQGGNLMAALTAERDRARAIAVALEQDLAEMERIRDGVLGLYCDQTAVFEALDQRLVDWKVIRREDFREAFSEDYHGRDLTSLMPDSEVDDA